MTRISAMLLVVLIIIACLTARANNSSANPTSDTTEEVTEASVVDFDDLSLVEAYCNGEWDGSFISNDEHCASIIDGKLWLDCQVAENVPDMGIYEDCLWVTVKSSDNTGTWIHNRQLGTVERWKKGTRYNSLVFSRGFDSYYTSVFVLSDCIIARNDTNIEVYTFEGGYITSVIDVIDCIRSGNEVLYSNFEHKNFSINGQGEEVELDTNYVRFPRENVELEEDSTATTAYFSLYWNTTWDGEFKNINGDFVYIDLYGDVYVNNKLTGNVNLPISNVITLWGANLMTGNDKSIYLDGKNLIYYQKADSTTVDIPDGEGKILWSDDKYGIVILIYGTNSDNNTLLIVRDEKVNIISEKIADANVAYDTLYFMEGDKVYILNWQEDNPSCQLFIEGAYAVSEHEDEREGAIVPSELNNMESYNQYNLYSPYGD